MTNITSTIAREDDGNVQITFTIPFDVVDKAQDDTVAEMSKDITVPGYRRGMAPLAKVKERITQSTLIEHALSHILPAALADAIKHHDLKIAVYPKYELISSKPGKDWQIRAITCELPEINLPKDLKEKLAGEIRAISLKNTPSREQKEQTVINYLVKNIDFKIPKILVEQEVNSRLSGLLARIEKLGLALEGYLATIGKTPETLRVEYESQALEAIKLDLILSKFVEIEQISVPESEISEALKASEADESNKAVISSILRKRKALELLTS